MSELNMAADAPARRVALLARDGAAREQLRHALAESGAELVCESDPTAFSQAQFDALNPDVVLVNLEPDDSDEALEALLAGFDTEVIFNDADASRGLEGWDLARWARHLASKVTGVDRRLPPMPEGAIRIDSASDLEPGAPPTPESFHRDETIDGLTGASRIADAQDIPTAPNFGASSGIAPAEDVAEGLEFAWSTRESSSLSDEAGGDAALPAHPGPAGAAKSDPGANSRSDDIDIDIDVFDSGELDEVIGGDKLGSSPPSPGSLPRDDQALLDEVLRQAGISGLFDDSEAAMDGDGKLAAEPQDYLADSDDEFDLAQLEGLTVEDSVRAEDEATFGADFDASDLPDSGSGGVFDDELGALAKQFEALAATDPEPLDDVPGADFDIADADGDHASGSNDTTSATAQASRGIAAAPAAGSASTFGELSLSDPDATPFAISAPPKSAAGFDFDGLDGLSLSPMDDSVSASGTASSSAMADQHARLDPGALLEDDRGDDSGADADFNDDQSPPTDMGADAPPFDSSDEITAQYPSVATDTAAGETGDQTPSGEASSGLSRVLVIGASIGGPDAVRTFVANLPADFAALVVVVQHLDNSVFDRLASQLAKAAKLPVAVARDGSIVRGGEILVIPASDRVQISRAGRVSFEPHSRRQSYSPCIDDVFCDLAATFGDRLTAIIMSGMAGDAVEGAVEVARQGGEVWVQDPESCVVSSMIDGAIARGVVEFTGSPRELAARSVARLDAD